ncbi:hypothetical protein PAXRUDRAFT_825276 [Paxillus rubicundulus Ve08.2h10]|uniref:Inhibitor I9 domain-containing protein n=1 Tax=Paxillus rubicundulus Ve08.2h10 TaxID=930991 RepID=A0A0D0E0S6_9AGAM|nr:hypothetical protein PAXRUDRAFT_825276 [Paxillus rubicundulus Ve08.2h10]
MAQKFIVIFNDLSSYQKYKKDVVAEGGTIVNDYGTIALGFAAEIPDTVLQLMRASGLSGGGILSLEADSVVTIQ